MQILFLILLFALGTCFGSFLCCEARRLHLRATKHLAKNKRSVCLSCHYQLKWYDNIPVVSWLFLKGKCRKCGKKIGLAELISELALGSTFLILGLSAQLNGITVESLLSKSPLIWLEYLALMIFILTISFLAIYDGLYGKLPTLCLTISIICAIIIVALREWASFSSFSTFGQHLASLFFAFLILGGLYFLLYKISHSKWVGDGDWLLGTALALVLGTPWLALIALFIANLSACLVMLPAIRRGRPHKIYFGPFMVVAFVVTFAFANFFQSML